MNENVPLPEIFIDLNAQMTATGYLLQLRGAIEDLAKRLAKRMRLSADLAE